MYQGFESVHPYGYGLEEGGGNEGVDTAVMSFHSDEYEPDVGSPSTRGQSSSSVGQGLEILMIGCCVRALLGGL